MSMTTLMALPADNNYRMVIVLGSGTTNVLLNQTFDRLKKDLSNCGYRTSI